MTLLEKAKNTTPKHRRRAIHQDEIALAIAWMKDDISTGQCAAAINATSSHTAQRMARVLKVAYAQGLITEAKK